MDKAIEESAHRTNFVLPVMHDLLRIAAEAGLRQMSLWDTRGPLKVVAV